MKQMSKQMKSPVKQMSRQYFDELCSHTFQALGKNEHLFVSLTAENSQFIRINGAKIRQTGLVQDAEVTLTLVYESSPAILHRSVGCLGLSGNRSQDLDVLDTTLKKLQQGVQQLPPDPYASLPRKLNSSSEIKKGGLLPVEAAAETLLPALQGADVAGIYAAGPVIRGMANSAGLSHWFETETFSFDYSFYTPEQKALKGTLAGTRWDEVKFKVEIENAKKQLELLSLSPRKVERGSYRSYLCPAAAAELVGMFSWRAIGESYIRQGDSPLRQVRNGEKSFSPRFTLSEDFRSGEMSRFNSAGELAPEVLTLIDGGRLVNTLINERTAKEHGLQSNGAHEWETLRSPRVGTGNLAQNEVLKRLDRGLYLSNLHYLNWSDQQAGRITGMTRYACFWVEGGKLVAPMESMRFDDSLFSLFGSALEDLTQHSDSIPETGTYGMRHLGAMYVPGMILTEMKFTI